MYARCALTMYWFASNSIPCEHHGYSWWNNLSYTWQFLMNSFIMIEVFMNAHIYQLMFIDSSLSSIYDHFFPDLFIYVHWCSRSPLAYTGFILLFTDYNRLHLYVSSVAKVCPTTVSPTCICPFGVVVVPLWSFRNGGLKFWAIQWFNHTSVGTGGRACQTGVSVITRGTGAGQ